MLKQVINLIKRRFQRPKSEQEIAKDLKNNADLTIIKNHKNDNPENA